MVIESGILKAGLLLSHHPVPGFGHVLGGIEHLILHIFAVVELPALVVVHLDDRSLFTCVHGVVVCKL